MRDAVAAADTRGGSLLTFRLGMRTCAIPVAGVREVTPLPALTPVPRAPAALLGLANVRGAVLPVLALSRLRDEHDCATAQVIVIDAGEPFGLAVSGCTGIVAGTLAPEVERIDPVAVLDACTHDGSAAAVRGASRRDEARQDAAGETLALMVFGVNGREFALPLAAVREVLASPARMIDMPAAGAAVPGSLPWRGMALPLISLARLLGLPAQDGDGPASVIVVDTGGGTIALEVEALRPVLRIAPADIDPAPPALAGMGQATIEAICRAEGGRRLVSLLAADCLLADGAAVRIATDASAGRPALAPHESGPPGEQHVEFRVGAQQFAIPLSAVSAVAAAPAPQRLTCVPRAPAFVAGAINLHGQVIPVIEPGRLSAGAAADGSGGALLVVRSGASQAGFIVDEVTGVTRLAAAGMHGRCLELSGLGLFDRGRAGEGTVAIDPQALIESVERAWPRGFARSVAPGVAA